MLGTRHAVIVLASGIALLLWAPTSLAQAATPALELRVEPALLRMDPGGSANATVRITYHPALPETGSVTIRLQIESHPEWANLALEPETHRITLTGAESTEVTSQLMVRTQDGVRNGTTDEIIIIAYADPTLTHGSAQSEAPVVIQVSGARYTQPTNAGQGSAPTTATPMPTPTPTAQDPRTTSRAQAAAEALARASGDPELTVQSGHGEGWSGGEALFIGAMTIGGAYAGHRLRRRFA